VQWGSIDTTVWLSPYLAASLRDLLPARGAALAWTVTRWERWGLESPLHRKASWEQHPFALPRKLPRRLALTGSLQTPALQSLHRQGSAEHVNADHASTFFSTETSGSKFVIHIS